MSLNLRDNEFVAILGPSGSGKTTLLNIIGGLDRYDSGDLIINGISTKKYKDRDWDSYRNHTIGFVFQSYNLIPHQTVLANVELALTISGVGKEERRKRAVDALEKVGLGQQLHKKPNQMSGGQMQRVAIARALATDPKVLLCDEATSALDPKTTRAILELLRKINRELGITLVVITHEMDVIKQVCNKVAIIEKGEIVEKGKVQDVFTKPKSQAAKKLFFPDEREKNTVHRATTKHRVRLVYDTQNAYEPIVSNMILELKAPINILYANMDVLNDIQKGQMVICLADDAEMAERQKQYLRDYKVEFTEIEQEGEDE